MTDAELTRLASKAFGNAPAGFSPLTDDGDAFRLAVKLGLIVDTRMIPKPRFDTDEVCTIAVLPRPSERSVGEWHADSDPYAATRRAIVRAAAASIGPAEPTQKELM